MLLKKYDPNWTNDFVSLKREIENGLIGIEYRIEHIGSTAVPYLDSKPIIDINIVHINPSDFENVKTGLEKIGYLHYGNQGIKEREVFKRSGQCAHDILDTIPHHLYSCPVGSKVLERHILFRDFLRKNDWARLEYQQLKYQLAKRANQDRKQYAKLKEAYVTDFIDAIIAKEK